jgi:hypothetical protein
MTRWVVLCVALAAAAPLLAGEDKPKKPGAPPPPPGIRWERAVEEALRRSREEGRPLLLCVNALENEGANVMLATERYPSESWGVATRGYVCLVGNPNDHEEKDGLCSRYGWTSCAGHKAALDWILKTFSPDGNLISPQHLILEPDGAVAYRKEYFTGEEGPPLFERYLSQVSPHAAYRQAAIQREARIDELKKAVPFEIGHLVREWLASSDGLAAAIAVNAYDDVGDRARRLAVVEALSATPAQQVLVLHQAAEEATGRPDDDPELALAWVKSLLAADRPMGVWAAARVVVRTKAPDLVRRTFEAWAGGEDAKHLEALPPGELLAALEASMLRGRPVAHGVLAEALKRDEGSGQDWRARLARAQREHAPEEPLTNESPAALRRSLLRASEEEVAKESKRVQEILGSPYARVRIAAALALLRARIGANGAVAAAILAALDDPIEGTEARGAAVEALGGDPGGESEEWKAAIEKAVGGGK